MTNRSDPGFATLLDVLRHHAAHRGEAPAFTFLDNGERVGARLSFAQLARQAAGIAAQLQALCAPGERVLLAYPPGLDYVAAFFGCLCAGLIAVPALPPANAKTLPRLLGMVRDAAPRVALSPPETAERMRAMAGEDGRWPADLLWLSPDAQADAAAWRPPAVQAGDIAFLQYTSGSTGTPKGVMVTHGNLMANARAIAATYGLEPGDTFVSWLPPHHDFGLIGGIVTPLVLGGHCVQFSPAAFLMRPHRWLKSISDWRAKATGGPNFAYALCAEKVTEAQKQGLDLSCLHVAVNGAERVRAATLRAFAQAFAGCGLAPGAMAPSYGLAESTLLVSANRAQRPDQLADTRMLGRAALAADRAEDAGADGDALELVGAGPAAEGGAVAIVQPDTHARLPANAVGEIWVRGPSVAVGYWQRAEESAQTFGARIADAGEDGAPWLRTGDLGFVDAQGHLSVTGRLKEMMIFSGENLYPQDIEATVEALDAGFRANGCAAFSIEDEAAGAARLVVVQEVETRGKPDTDTLIDRLRLAVYERHGIAALAAVLLVKAGQLPRTSSGKIQRVACRGLFEQGAFEPVWAWRADGAASAADAASQYAAPATPTEAALAAIWQELLGIEAVSVEAEFFALGGHSLLASQIAARVRDAFGVELELAALFEAPTVRALAARIDAPGAQSAQPGSDNAPALLPRDGDRTTAPLSFAQQRLWFLDQYAPGDAAYNIATAVELRGPLDAHALEAALNGVIARHASLRTRFAQDARGEPVQVIGAALRLDLPVRDVQDDTLDTLIRAEARKPFDLARGPLIRAQLLRTQAQRHLLLLTLHHIVSDGWSMGVLVRELGALYAARLQGRDAALAPLPIQYADYAAWQRAWLQGPELERQLSYWTRQLQGAPGLLTLPTDHPRPPVQRRRGARHRFGIDAALAAQLKTFAQQRQATLFMALAGVFATLLARHAGQAEVNLGTAVANRGRGATEGLIGLFVNTLVLRIGPRPDEGLGELLARVKRIALDAFAHQDLPFERLVEALRPERHGGHAPLVQAMLVLQNAPMDAIALPGLQARQLPVDNGTAKFDVLLELTEQQGGALAAELEYDTDLFEAATIQRLAARFLWLLAQAVAAPDTPVLQLPLLPPDEHRQVVVDWNATGTVYPQAGSTLDRLLAAQALRAPEATALVFEGEHLSYAQLHARANRLAHHLRAQGVGPDATVAVCMQRGVAMVVSLLAVLKAGGAYLPLDPGSPAERLRAMLEDARPALVLAQQDTAGAVAEQGAAVFRVDAQWHELAALPETPLAPTAWPASLAYVIFTSGSTGRPKGVGVPHAGIVNRLLWMQQAYGLGAQDRVLQKTPFSFDVSVWEFFWPLMAGATLVVAKPGVHRDADGLLDTIAAERITTLHFVPPMLDGLLAAPRLARMAGVQRVICSGQALPRELQDRFFAALPGVELHNLYGPTEASVDVTAWACVPGSPRAGVPIGHPIANTRMRVLDAEFNPAPPGVAGELFIAGVQLARGYLHRPDLTAERFIPDPFGPAGARMYRTGDLARYLADGAIDYVGRIDHQVKIRGFRIELGEIEAALAAQPGVRDAVVLARRDQPGEARLAAYVLAEPGAALDAGALRAALAQRLPDYMVPAHYLALDAFPLTPNGKVDRAALPAPEAPASTGEQTAPQGALETTLAALWAQLLGAQSVGRDDDFFALGGHSLLATQLVARLRDALAIELPVRAVFEAPTITQLAERLQTQGAAEAPPPLEPAPRIGPQPLSFAQQRLWFLDRLSPDAAQYNMAAALRLDGALDVDALRAALDAIVARHAVLRTRFTEVDGEPLQAIAHAEPLPLPVDDLRTLPTAQREREAQSLARADARRPFDLARGPVLRTRLLRLADEAHVLLVAMHHIVSDGWSMRVFARELVALYGAARAGAPAALPPLPLQYADYARWQRAWLQGPVLERQLAWWRAQLQGAPELLALPTDRPRAIAQAQPPAAGELPFALDAGDTQALRQLARAQGATLFMVLLAALDVVLARHSGQDDLCVGVPIAGRTQSRTEPLVGCFVNTLVLRARVDLAASFEALLRQVRAATLGAYAHQDLPFEQLVEALRPARDAGHTPLFQVMLALQDAALPALRLPGLQAALLPAAATAAKFDLTLDLHEDAGRIAGRLEFDARLFDADTVARFGEHLRRVLRAVAAQPQAPLHTHALLGADARRALLADDGADFAAPPAVAIAQLFEAQARRQPDAIAVIDGDERLSYRDLNAQANRLAHRLRAQGVGPDVTVGLCLSRGARMVAALLGILKAGGAYLPIDAAYPDARLAFLLQDARPALLVTDDALAPRFAALGVPLLSLDAQAQALAALPATDPPPSALPEHLACVFYTSGSTGTPKGVMVTQRNVLRLVLDGGYAHLRGGRVVAQASTVSFDAATFELWGALLHGGTLVVIDTDTLLAPGRLQAQLRQHAVETLFVTTALFNRVAQEAPASFGGLDTLLFGGEAVSPQAVAAVARHGMPGRLLHVYGPTENTTFSTGFAVTPRHLAALPHAVPIGRGLAGTATCVLDAFGEPVPTGVTGELYLGGPGLARGYLGRPALTAERFVPDPFGAPGGRLYRTGDLVRRLASGDIEYVGRADFQVKIRGFRIEPGEIEAALARQPGVREALVLAREDAPGDKRLVAYVRADAGEGATAQALRAALAAELPDYMLPAHIVPLERFPLNANGKIDRAALPAPDPQAGAGDAFVAPRTPLERQLAALWAEVLNVPRVGIHDDFFALGGHSLLATRVVSRLRQLCGVEVPLRTLFEAPTVEAMARRIAADHAAPVAPPLRPVPREAFGDGPPLSFAQQRLWFLDRFEPGTAQYNMPVALRLAGVLDRGALQRTFDTIARRHESLRTRFEVSADGQPLQRIDAPSPAALPLTDLGALPPAEREAEARRLVRAEAQAPFDLARGPLLRQQLLRLAPQEHLLLVTMHHIVSDGWSMSVLVREVGALYAAFAQGRPDPLPALPVQYADYAHWQRQWLQGPAPQRELDYWRAQLADAPALLALPTDRPRPPVRTHHGASLPFALDAELARRLNALCRAQGATLFMGLLAGFSLLLSRYSGQRDVSVGSFIANRTQAEIEPLIGFFLNTLVLRTRIEPEASFTELLAGVRDTTLAAYAHQQVPFEQLLEALKPQRDTSYSPLFQAMLVLQNLPDLTLSLPGLRMETLPFEHEGARFDLTLELFEAADGGLQGRLEFNTDLFDEGTIDTLGRRLQRLLRALVARPDAPLSSHDLLEPAEHRQLRQWNATEADYPRALAIAQRFERIAHAQPDATALAFQGRELSYGELNARANRLAHRLRAQGVGPDALVAVSLARGMDMIVALLGILKAGGAYLPLDASYPAERLAFMLEDARPALLLTEPALAGTLPAAGLPTLLLDAQAHALASQPADDPAPLATPAHLAYVIYTSGSTGKPKGVLVEQRGLGNQVSALGRRYGLGPRDRVLQFAALSFDMSVEEIFGALLHGAALVLRDDSWLTGPSAFAQLCAGHGVTVANLPTSFWRLIANAPGLQLPACLRQIAVGGEAVLPADLRAWFAQAPRPALFNAYGPTEATVNAAIHQPLADPATWSAIGAPMANTRLHVLDAQGNPVPVGIAGELFIAGEGVARGYLGRAALTAERFLPEPFAPEPGARMYRTGDLARWRADGTIEYLGRVDHQVKIRGFRVELGEIESVLGRQPGVREALVLAREPAPGDTRLVAYVCGEAGTALQPAALRAGLAAELPEYMVPAHIVPLERMPLTPNGKIDRAALPAPDLQPGEGDATYAAPRTPLEAQLAALWAGLLGLPRVGIHDNFFALGGHSLLAVQLVERMRQAGIAADVRTLFSQPTVAALAQQAQRGARAEVAVPPNRIPPDCAAITPDMLTLVALAQEHIDTIVRATPGGARNVQDIYPLAPLQEGILFHHLMQREGDAYLLPTLLAFDTRGQLERFVDALQRVIARHDILRTAVLWDGLPQPVQVVWRDAPMQPEWLDLAPGEGGDVAAQLQARFDPRRWRMDVRQAPLLRAVACAHDAPNDRWLLQLMLHHLTSDHTTGELVVHEVLRLLQDGDARHLPAPVPFRNAVAQALLGVPQSEHEAFFRRMLGAVDEPTLPFGLAQVQGDGSAIEDCILPVPMQLSHRIRAQARAAGVSAASLMHLAWALVLARTAHRARPVFGTLLLGRMQGAGAELAVGMFINTLPVAIDLAGRGAREALQATHRLLAELLSHEHASLALAQRASGVAAPAPLFSSILNVRHSPEGAQPEPPAWSGMRVLSARERSNYPIALSVDDLGVGFALDAQVDARLGAARVAGLMLQALDGLVGLLESAPDAPVSGVEVLPAHELLALQAVNATARAVAPALTVVQRIAQQAAARPGAIALECAGERLTYADLDRRADRLAHTLRARGVAPDAPVALCATRGVDMVVGLLAILKAGGAYLPLDADYPPERLAFMLEDARPALLLTQRALLERLPAQAALPVLCLDAADTGDGDAPDTDPPAAPDPRHLAYVIYTSGSTGRPKGVMVEHRQLANLVDWHAQRFALAPGERAACTAGVSFDAFGWELWPTLCMGGTVALAPPGDPLQLLEWWEAQALHSSFLVTALGELALQRGHFPANLRSLLVGGDRLGQAPAQALPFALVNNYGPTECTVVATSGTVQAGEAAPPIGAPIANTRIHLLDAFLNPVPQGAGGELFIAGDGVARGYLHRPALTAERFLPDPFGPPGSRMYRSGDLARLRADGALDYLGRADQQVKLRGLRIELGEIEAALARQPRVRQAAVIAREDAPGDRRLVAYVCIADEALDGAPTEATLRAALARELPEFMVPAHILFVAGSLPLTPNGKLDRAALPVPQAMSPAADYVAPRTPLEAELATLWAEVLNLPRVGVEDNFFTLGGHSLLATQAVSRLRARLAPQLPLQALFEDPTVARMAARIAAQAPAAARAAEEEWGEELL